MASSSPSPFSNTGKLQVIPNSTILFAPTSTSPQTIRQTNSPNTTFIQQQTPTNIVRLNQPNQYSSSTVWTNNSSQYSSNIKTEPSSPAIQQQQSILPTKLVAQPVVRQTVTGQPAQRFTEAQINDFVAKCRTFLTTLLKLAEKQAPEKLPMVRSCIQDLLDGTIDPESFTQRLHTLYKSQPHTSLVPFFKLALPHMRHMVRNTFGVPITIELLEKLNIPTSKNNATTPTTTTTATPSRVVVNPSLLTQQSSSLGQQPLLYTTVQPQQKINLLQQTPQSTLIGSTTSLLSQQQQQQQQARTQISIAGIRPVVATISPSTSTNLLTGQQSIQPVTQTIIQPSDSLLQRTFLSPTTNTTVQQPQIITVNHQPIRTNQQPSLIQIQQRTILKNDDDCPNDSGVNNGLLTISSSGTTDDRNARHIIQDDRLLPSLTLRRRLDHLIKEKRWEGGNMLIHDESVSAMISHATEQRLKYLIDQIKDTAYHREAMFNLAEENDDESEEKITTKKRKFDEDITVQQLKKLRSIKHKCRGNLDDLISIMEKDKHLKRSSLLYKVLDKSS